MPNSVFDPLKAVAVHSNVLLDPDNAIGVLQGEQYLLIHECSCRGSRKTFEDHDKDGKLIFMVEYDPRLRWSIDADVLAATGLANYHPGASLSTEALTFANGETHPFLFENETGVYVYRDPVRTPDAGGLVAVNFDIELIFGGLTQSPVPEAPALYSSFVSAPTYPYAPSSYASVPTQTVVELATACRTALLRDVFNSVAMFDDTEDVTFQCLTTSDVAITPERASGAWSTPVVGSADYIYKSSNAAVVEFNNISLSVRSVVKIRVARGGLTLRDITLAAPLSVPAGYGIRIPIGALLLQLTWPLDGTPLPSAADRPARHLLPYVLGGLRSSVIANALLYVTWSDADFSSPTDYDANPSVPATSVYWTVSGVTVTAVNIQGATNAPPGGWTSASVLVHLNSASARVIRELYVDSAAESTKLLLDGLILDLEDTPD